MSRVRVVTLLAVVFFASLPVSSQTANPAAQFILGPQVPLSNKWFDTTQVNRGRAHADAFPAAPPSPEQLDAYILNHYYDLGLTMYQLHARTNEPADLARARKVSDSWWLSPYIKGGTVRNFDSGGPAPRHAGIGGLILRALDGRPEMFDWINAYTRYHFDHWLKQRISDPSLFYGLREGAFLLHYAVWLAIAHPDAVARAQWVADVEAISVSYFGRLQKEDGSWRWDDFDYTDSDGGTLKGITQPFMVGLLLNALVDVHRLSTNASVRANVLNQIVKSCRHLYFGGPFRTAPVPELNGVRWADFWYFYHGGTSVNPAKYERGGGNYIDISQGAWVIPNGRQAISTVFTAFAYAYLMTGDKELKTAAEDLFNSAFVGSDGFRGMADDTAKNYNQTYRMGSRFQAWMSQTATPTPTPGPVPQTLTYETAFPAANSDLERQKVIKDMALQGWVCQANPGGKFLICHRVKL